MQTFSALCVSDAGEAAVAHLWDALSDEQRSATEAGPVSDHGPPHRGAAHRSETGWWDPFFQFWDQPGPRWEESLRCQLYLSVWFDFNFKGIKFD